MALYTSLTMPSWRDDFEIVRLVPEQMSVPSDGSSCLLFAALLEVLRQAIETRKTALVEIALDLIQRLIAHQALQVGNAGVGAMPAAYITIKCRPLHKTRHHVAAPMLRARLPFEDCKNAVLHVMCQHQAGGQLN